METGAAESQPVSVAVEEKALDNSRTTEESLTPREDGQKQTSLKEGSGEGGASLSAMVTQIGPCIVAKGKLDYKM